MCRLVAALCLALVVLRLGLDGAGAQLRGHGGPVRAVAVSAAPVRTLTTPAGNRS